MLKLRWLMLLLLALVPPAQARAQEGQDEPVTWQVVPGWDGRLRSGAWFPLDVTLSNSGPDVRGTLEFRIDGIVQPLYMQPIDLPHNGRKRVVLPVQSGLNDAGPRRGTLVLRSGDVELKSERVALNVGDSFGFYVGVVADGQPLPELSNLQGRGQAATLLRMTGAQLPERPELLQSFDVLFISDSDTASWTDAQRASLATWLNQGNTLVVGGAPDVLRGLDGLLPAAWEEGDAVSGLQALSNGTDFDALPDAEPTPVLGLTPRPGAETLWSGDADLPLVVRGHYGLGTVLQAAFGLEQLNRAGDAARFWQNLVQPLGDRPPVWLELRQRAFSTIQGALALPELGLPSILAFVAFLLVYIAVVGPLNYVLLRRLDRREWAYVTIPLVVLVFSGVAYVWGSVGRGRDAQVNELAIVRVDPEGDRAQAISYLTVYSPSRRRYDIGVAGDALLGPIDAWDTGGPRLDVRYDEDAVTLPELLIDVGGVRGVTAEHAVAAPPLSAERLADGTVRLRNAGDMSIEDVTLVRGDGAAQLLGTLDPGEQQTVEPDPIDFIQAVDMSGDGAFNRQAIINGLGDTLVLAGPGGFMPAPAGVVQVAPGADPDAPDARERADELFVVGWQVRPTLQATVNGSAATIGGESLIVWPVREAQP